MELQRRLPEIRAQGLGIAAISYDAPEVLAAFSRRYAMSFPLLSDAGSATIRAYGILNTIADAPPAALRDNATLAADFRKYVTVTSPAAAAVIRGTPFPGTFIVDRQGRVTSRKMHVYAPGAVGYRVVALRVEPQPYVRVPPVQYPPSETYFFAPLNERVPVYQKEFRLIQDVVLEARPEAERALEHQKSLTLRGSLEYQACDDRICFNPTSIPLSWTLTITPNITERVTRPR